VRIRSHGECGDLLEGVGVVREAAQRHVVQPRKKRLEEGAGNQLLGRRQAGQGSEYGRAAAMVGRWARTSPRSLSPRRAGSESLQRVSRRAGGGVLVVLGPPLAVERFGGSQHVVLLVSDGHEEGPRAVSAGRSRSRPFLEFLGRAGCGIPGELGDMPGLCDGGFRFAFPFPSRIRMQASRILQQARDLPGLVDPPRDFCSLGGLVGHGDAGIAGGPSGPSSQARGAPGGLPPRQPVSGAVLDTRARAQLGAAVAPGAVAVAGRHASRGRRR
jgi:hypothetical protein